jgi:hypothetical protein
MQMGYNSDVRHNGVIVHIQTEDQGINAAKIETQVFFSGTILDSRVLSYSELVENSDSEDELNEEVQRRMKALHKYFHNQIRRGTYDHRLPAGGDSAPDAAEVGDETAASPAPAADEELTQEPAEAAQKATGTDDAKPSRSESRAPAYLGVEEVTGRQLGDAILAALG